MKRARFRRMLVWAMAGPVTLLAVLAITFLLLIRWLNGEADRVEQADRVLSAAQRTQALLIDMETGVRGYLLTRDNAFLAPYRKATPRVGPAFDELLSLVRDDPTQRERVVKLRALYSDWQQLAARTLAPQSDAEVRDEAQIAGREQMDAIRRSFAEFIAAEEQFRATRVDAVRRVTRTVILMSMAATLFLGLTVGMLTRRALRSVAMDYEEALAQSEAARKQSEALAVENDRLYRQADSASRAKDEFLATLSHELRTPLTAILGWSRLLQIQESDPENVKSAVAAIERGAQAQAALIDDILDVSRIITGKFTLELRQLETSECVRAAVESIQPAASAKGIDIVVDSPPGIVVSADPNRLQQVLWNLLSNAVKFSGRGTLVRVTVRAAGDDVTLTVADEGTGIEPSFLPYVFDRFRQADSTFTREFGGLGIGLSVVKLLVELHGGTVRAVSPGLGKGATFIVTIPSHRDDVTTAMPLKSKKTIGEGDRSLAGREVLIIDDDIEARAVIGAMLTNFGARVSAASGVHDAMAHLLRQRFDVILTDIAMPAEDGLGLLRRLRAANGPNRQTPVIAVTALSGTVSVDGDDSFAARIQKPVDPAALAATVASMIR